MTPIKRKYLSDDCYHSIPGGLGNTLYYLGLKDSPPPFHIFGKPALVGIYKLKVDKKPQSGWELVGPQDLPGGFNQLNNIAGKIEKLKLKQGEYYLNFFGEIVKPDFMATATVITDSSKEAVFHILRQFSLQRDKMETVGLRSGGALGLVDIRPKYIPILLMGLLPDSVIKEIVLSFDKLDQRALDRIVDNLYKLKNTEELIKILEEFPDFTLDETSGVLFSEIKKAKYEVRP